MKGFIFLGLMLCADLVQSQDLLIGDDIFNNQFIDRTDMLVTEDGKIFVAGIDDNDYLKVMFYNGSSWANTSSEFLDSSVFSAKFVYNSVSDSIFLGYTKADGFYLRSFDSGWDSPEYIACSPSTWTFENEILGVINVSENSPIFLFRNLAPSDNTTMIIFDSFNSTLELVNGPEINDFLSMTALIFNSLDNYPYYIYRFGGDLKIEKYNGLSWSAIEDNVANQNNLDYSISKAYYLENENKLLLGYSYGAGSSYYLGIVSYDLTTNAKEIVIPEASFMNAVELLNGSIDLTNNSFIFEYSNGTYLGWDDADLYDVTYTGYAPSNFNFDQNGRLYWLSKGTVDYRRDVYYKNAYTLSTPNSFEDYFLIYPNPATKQIQINSDELNSVSFYSIDGALVAEGYTVSKSQPLIIDFLPSGLYLVRLVDPNGKVTQQRVVVE